MRLICLIISFIITLTTCAIAQETSQLRTLITGNDNRGWEAVGRLNIAGRAFCTGALIAPDLVVTAAHCLFDKTTGERIQASEIEFLAGWRNGAANAYADVRQAIAHPDYDFISGDRLIRVAKDVALLQLMHPIRKSSVVPFETGRHPRKNAEVGVVSYAHDRSESPSFQELCQILARRSGTLVLSCDVDFGSSGAPIFSIDEAGKATIVSLVSAKANVDGRQVALGTSLLKPLQELRALIEQAPKSNAPDQRPRLIQTTPRNPSSGAKFVRP